MCVSVCFAWSKFSDILRSILFTSSHTKNNEAYLTELRDTSPTRKHTLYVFYFWFPRQQYGTQTIHCQQIQRTHTHTKLPAFTNYMTGNSNRTITSQMSIHHPSISTQIHNTLSKPQICDDFECSLPKKISIQGINQNLSVMQTDKEMLLFRGHRNTTNTWLHWFELVNNREAMLFDSQQN